MVKIKYYQDPLKSEFTECDHNNVMSYLLSSSFSKDQLLDLRFFHDEILGDEIDQSELSFLDISKGTVAVTLNSMIPRGPETWVYLAISIIVSVATVLLIPSVKPAGNTQSSATNSLGSSSNESRINERIDDIFGTVTKHTPSLWQAPYRIGVDNQETEVLLLAVGRGKYLIEESGIYDGNTKVLDIPNSQFSKYEPGTYPSNGSPSLQIGDDIDEKIGIYRQSNDLNPSELLPPNDLVNSDLKWRLSGLGSTGTMKAVFIPVGFDFQDYYQVGDTVFLADINYFNYDEIEKLYSEFTQGDFLIYDPPVDLGVSETLAYVITSVSVDTLTITIPLSSPLDVLTAWSLMTNYDVPEISYLATNDPSPELNILMSNIAIGEWYDNNNLDPEDLLTVTTVTHQPRVGASFIGTLGPFVVPDSADEIILNFVSESGFYKLSNNNETPIVAEIEVLIEETDINGNTTGQYVIYPVSYDSNISVRKSVFKTERIEVPYSRSVVSAVRTTPRDKSNSISNVDIIKWRDLYTFENVSNLDFGDVTLAHVVIPSNSESRLIKERKQNMDVTRLITEYKGFGEFGNTESLATNDFAQILIHISLDNKIGRLNINNINADGLILLSEQINTYFGSSDMVNFGYDFDDTQITYQDIFIQICEVVNCMPYVQNGVYDAFFEKLQNNSSMQVTCRNKIEGSESREQTFSQQFDGVEVSYRDELTSISETIYIPTDRTAINPDRIELPGCISEIQAFRYAYRKFNKQLYNNLKVTFEVDEFGRNVIPGKRIDSPDSTRFTLREGVTDGYRIYDGEVLSVLGMTVELSEPVEFTVNEDHYIVFTNSNGENSESILCTRIDDFTVLLSALPSSSLYDGYNKDRSKYTFSSEQLRGSIALIPQTIEFKIDDDGNEVNTIGSINYSDQYYKNDHEVPQ